MKAAALRVLALAAALAFAPGTGAAELIVNGGFESPALAAGTNSVQQFPASWIGLFPSLQIKNTPAWSLHDFYPAGGADGDQFYNLPSSYPFYQTFTLAPDTHLASVSWSDALHGAADTTNTHGYVARLVRASDSAVIAELSIGETDTARVWRSRSLPIPAAPLAPGDYRLEFAPLTFAFSSPTFIDTVSVQTGTPPPLAAYSTIARALPYAYAANAGWINFRPTLASGAIVTPRHLAGHAYAANFGWISLGDGSPANGLAYTNTDSADHGVNFAVNGDLSGLAYAANLGWINFGWAAQSPQNPDRPRLDLRTGRFSGFVWAANLGWIDLGAATLRHSVADFPDLDADGLPDAYELEHFANLSTAGATTDQDSDGQTDLAEYRAGTDPVAPASVSPVGGTAQMITFAQPANLVYGAAPLALAATSDSGLPVTLEKVSGPGVLELDATGPSPVWRYTIDGVGPVTLRARQRGDATRAPAPDLVRSFVVSPISQTITFPAPPAPVLGGPSATLTATASSGFPVRFTLAPGGAARLSGATLSYLAPGPVSIRADQDGDEFHAPATPVEHSLTVSPRPVSTLALADTIVTYNGLPRPVTATVSPAGFNVTYTYRPATAAPTTATATPPTDAGAYSVTATVADPRSADSPTATATLTILKATLVASGPELFRPVGQGNPTFFFAPAYSGFVNHETRTVIDREPVVTTTATRTSPAGVYPLTLSGGLDNNYSLVYSPGTLTVIGFGGTYEALLRDPARVRQDGAYAPLGKLEITVSASSLAFTGTLTVTNAPAPIPINGTLTHSYPVTATGEWARLAPPGSNAPIYAVAFTLLGDTLTGDVLVGGSPSTITSLADATRVLPLPAGAATPRVGAYTLSLSGAFPFVTDQGQGQQLPPLPYPRGAGHATGAVAATTGILSFKGKLGDGTTLTASAKPDATGRHRFFVKPYGTRLDSHLAGQLALTPRAGTNRYHVADGLLLWTKKALPAATPASNIDKSYRAGFGPLDLTATLDPWLPPALARTGPQPQPAVTLPQRLGLASNNTTPGAFSLSYQNGLSLGALASSLPVAASLGLNNLVSVTAPITTPANATKWKMTVTPSTGAFSGSFVLSDLVPPATRPTARTVAFSGVLRRGPAGDTATVGLGHFLLPALPGAASTEQASGEIRLTAPAPSQ